MSELKNLEQKLRRTLTKQGYQLKKSRARNWSYNNFLGYMIVNPYDNTIECGERFDLSLEDVARFAEG